MTAPTGYKSDSVKHLHLLHHFQQIPYQLLQLAGFFVADLDYLLLGEGLIQYARRHISYQRQGNHLYTEIMSIMNAGCYRIKVLDSAGDGLTGSAVFGFSDAQGHTLFTGGPNTHLGYGVTYELYCDGTLSVASQASVEMAICPNPSNGRFELMVGEGVWQVEVFDVTGRKVYQNNQFTHGEICLEGNVKGVYFLRATNGSEEFVKKLMVY